ncbi:MAG TPA: adenylate/guanylate cyclase domain-containing protein [Albidovulum sp.]|uniref:adenylate/guanylate cyclase domain-containing protein n=1 Tax=Albidovulum sp. TaxID=1872424 RepID=UPI002CE8649B|nr:adenylate/guanylate cyclase domain-containing protein [Albidovulum sp.]
MDGSNFPAGRPLAPLCTGTGIGIGKVEMPGDHPSGRSMPDIGLGPVGTGSSGHSAAPILISRQASMRRLVAVFASDVFGFASLLAQDQDGTLANLGRDRRDRIEPAIHDHGGHIVKCIGDGMLVVFESVLDAVECALDIQNSQRGCAVSMPLRIGINLCDAILEGDDIYGHGVNIAFRVEGLAPPGGICITAPVHETVTSQIHAAFSDAGEQSLKNINRSVHVFVWSQVGAPVEDEVQQESRSAGGATREAAWLDSKTN